MSECNVSLKTLLQEGLFELEFYGDLVYKVRNILAKLTFSEQFKTIVIRYKKICHNNDILRQTACMVINQIVVDNFAFLFNCTTESRP